MAERRTHPNGGVYERGPDGQWHLVSASPSPMVDPRLAPQVQKAQNEAIASQVAPQIAQSEATIKGADAGVAGVVAVAERDRAIAEARKSEAELEKLRAEQSKVDPKSGAYRALQGQIDRVSELYRQQLKGGLPNAINSVVPDFLQPKVDAFDSAAQGLVNPFMAAFKVEGQGSQSDADLRQFLEANTPTQSDSDEVIQEKIGNIQRRLDAQAAPQGVTQSNALPPIGGQAPQYAPSDGMRDEIDPALKATGARVSEMLAEGVPSTKIKKFLTDSGVDPNSTSIDDALRFRLTDDFKRWQRANPSKPYPLGPEFYTRQVPMSDARRLLNQGVQSDLGGTAAAGLAASANAITGGRLDNMSANPEMARTAMMALRQAHPASSLAGDMLGQGTTEMLLGRIPGARSLMASQWGRRGADAAYGAYSGSGENDENPLMGAITGAGINAGFSALGRSAQRGAGRMATGVRNPDLQYLHARNVPLTLGQIGRGSDNVVGHAFGGIEERMAGMPIADAIISSARRRGDEGFNSAAFREMGGSGATGSQGIIEGQGLVNKSYDFLNGSEIPIDPQFREAQSAVRNAVQGIPAFGRELTKTLGRLDNVGGGGTLSGRDWQSALRSVKSNRASIKGKEFADDAYGLLGQVEDNLYDLASRQGPPGSVDKLLAANKLNAQFKTLSGALDNGPAQKADELFSAGRLDDASRINTRKYGGQTASLSGYRPFYELSSAGKAVMPNLTPDSGTAGRSLLYSGLIGGGIGGGAGFVAAEEGQGASGGTEGVVKGLGIAALMAAPYSKGGQRAIQNALLGKRSPMVERIGEYLISRPRLAGMFGGAIGRDYFMQPELP